jgi:type II secretory ATPase GspE/PulE/Tfp pilus assembly ATPase PilB-like protein
MYREESSKETSSENKPMLSSQGKQSDPKAAWQQLLTNTQNNGQQAGTHELLYQLIDSLLSFEACVYHQILPLQLEDKTLLLAMVDLEDSAALDYVSRILSYINVKIETHLITIESHHAILSAYLNYKSTYSVNAQQKLNPTAEESIAPTNSNNQTPPAQRLKNSQEDFIPEQDTSSLTHINNTFREELQQNLPVIPVLDSALLSPIEVIGKLPPKKLLEELLGRVLSGGIGRLYLERQPYEGRILWSDNGILRSVVNDLPLPVFQGVLNELKRFTALPTNTFSEARQIEKEYVYQQSLLLLRLRVMPGIYGEEATLQVLRGVALKFYQQQQLTRLNSDILGISKQLAFRLQELQQRLRLNPDLEPQQLQALAALDQIQENLDQQLRIVTTNGHLTEGGKKPPSHKSES